MAGLAAGKVAETLGSDKASEVINFLIGFSMPDIFGSSIPAGEYNVYAVTTVERYRLTDPSTGQFYGWQKVSMTSYYINCGEWIQISYQRGNQ